jgi:Zn-dependent membrane protease YugP
MFYGFDITYFYFVVPALILSLWAQFKVKSAFSRYSQVMCSKNITGAGAARLLMQANGISDVSIESVDGSLTDHYDPGRHVLRLSRPVYGERSVAAIGVAAHETGHAIQHARGYGPLFLRSTLVPVANIGSTIGPWLAIAGLFVGSRNGIGGILFNLGIVLFGVAVLFYLVTLPVEFNASSRALAILQESQVLTEDELRGVKKVLSAAALTYVASALMALMSLVRLLFLSRRRR